MPETVKKLEVKYFAMTGFPTSEVEITFLAPMVVRQRGLEINDSTLTAAHLLILEVKGFAQMALRHKESGIKSSTPMAQAAKLLEIKCFATKSTIPRQSWGLYLEEGGDETFNSYFGGFHHMRLCHIAKSIIHKI